MSELKWNWVYYPYLDAPNEQEESALKAGYIKVVDKSEADKVISRHKYKRCLAMAKWCGDACDKWMMRKAKAISLGKDGVEGYHRARRKLFHYMRWQMRWLELAEKFKDKEEAK